MLTDFLGREAEVVAVRGVSVTILAIALVAAAVVGSIMLRSTDAEQAGTEQTEVGRVVLGDTQSGLRPGVSENVHPITAGPERCLGCHIQRDDAALLAASVVETCARCHDAAHATAKPELPQGKAAVSIAMTGADSVASSQAVLDGESHCQACHDSHGKLRKLLRGASFMDLCTDCHDAL